ncbi:MAG: hypothetical protein MI919_29140 [Holophagales bacterium]|nr:hypothetical protein [Holophagales bacterium]
MGHQITHVVGRPRIQRAVDLGAAETTEGCEYGVLPNQRETLYSELGATPPVPSALYSRKTEDVANTDGQVRAWVPNVRLLSNAEHQSARGGNLGTNARRGVLGSVETPQDLNVDKLPDLAMLGKNDCGFFATALQTLMVDSGEVQPVENGQARTLDLSVQETAEEVDENMNVGWRMWHHYQGQQQCSHHAATVVAKDGPSLVTLEGHVGKDLQRPQFHIREGASGFAEDNQQNRNLGKRVNIRPPLALSQNDVGNLQDLYSGGNRNIDRGYTWTGGVGMKKGLLIENLYAAVKDLLERDGWNNKGQSLTLKGWKWNKVPGGIRAMRNALNTAGNNHLEALRAVRRLAIDHRDDPPLIATRHNATKAAYRALAKLDSRSKKVPGVLRRLGAVVGML